MTRDLASRRNRAAALQQRRPAAAAEPPQQIRLVTVEWHGEKYPAAPFEDGAAWELFSALPRPDFIPNPRPGTDYPHRWFVHANEVLRDGVPVSVGDDRSMMVPLAPGLDLEYVRRLSQTPHLDPAARVLLNRVRQSSPLVEGELMERPMTASQVARLLETAAVPGGFCYRRRDVAYLRTPASRSILGGETEVGDRWVFALRWPVADPADYHAPVAPDYEGLSSMPSSDRRGMPVLGTGFALTGGHLLPEYVTADLVDLPLPEGAKLVAHATDGVESELFVYSGQQWTPSTADRSVDVPGVEIGRPRTVRRILREATRVVWKGESGSLVDADEEWGRFRLSRPSPDALSRTGAEAVRRGVYEKWVARAEITNPE
ncbi:hypothetical protein L0U85_07450 [Glycomyces sp. L485]|uniref:hypothetical protein n=1 Tax=Glycomyces sp. L485 TaxID=2909235 RepID=UPI001F4A0EC8|nr:hypothetical protein [Glycomyces sp. L485]MCH7230685.1 hypothetical protein [Glycomyces sp. L485]